MPEPQEEPREEIRTSGGPVQLTSGRHYRIVAGKARQSFVVVLPIDPASAAASDDRFTLRGGSGEPAPYCQHKSVRDDLVQGDRLTTLEFTELEPGLRYTLEVDLGQGDRYTRFRDVPYAELLAMDSSRIPYAPHPLPPPTLPAEPLPPAAAPPAQTGLLATLRAREQAASLEALFATSSAASLSIAATS